MTETHNRKCARDLAIYSGSKSAAEPSARGISYSSAIAKAGVKQPPTTAPAAKLGCRGENMQTVSVYGADTSADPEWRRVVSDIVLRGSGASAPDARHWTRILGRYTTTSRLRGVAELAITALPLAMLWISAWFTFSIGHSWATLLIAIPAAGFLLRLFLIQHDCGHGTFFAQRLGRPRHWHPHADAL